MLLIGRIEKGQCDSNVGIFESLTCNPLSNAHSIPSENVVYLYVTPFLLQIVIAPSLDILIFIWIIVVGFLTYSFVIQGAWLDIWSLIQSIMFMNVSIEMERIQRLNFVNTLISSRNERVIAEKKQLERNHQIEILSITAENEKKLIEAESKQMRSLMANVAHDLKTPLHCIQAEIELLRIYC